MSETEIVNKLGLDAFKKIFELCVYVGKSETELESLTGLNSRDIAEDLKILEGLQAIQLSGGKWVATPLGKRVWVRYFAEAPG